MVIKFFIRKLLKGVYSDRKEADLDLLAQNNVTWKPTSAWKNQHAALVSEKEQPQADFGHNQSERCWIASASEKVWKGTLPKQVVLGFLPPPGDDARTCGPGPFSMANQEMVTRQMGPGRFQMTQQQVCDDCPNVK